MPTIPPTLTEPLGIHQSDIIIRSALIAGLDDLRANPWLLDYVFSSLPKDDLTKNDYGQREVDNAKKWFLNTEIPVIMNTRIDETKVPAISVSLMDSNESDTTLGDVHYVPVEYTVEKDSKAVTLESLVFKETYSIGCHAAGETTFATYLHSIVVFILLRYKQRLLEARGFERSTVSSSDFRRNEMFENEMVFSRWISLSGYVRNYWPKDVDLLITSTEPAVIVTGADALPNDTDPADSLWIGDQDALTLKLK